MDCVCVGERVYGCVCICMLCLSTMSDHYLHGVRPRQDAVKRGLHVRRGEGGARDDVLQEGLCGLLGWWGDGGGDEEGCGLLGWVVGWVVGGWDKRKKEGCWLLLKVLAAPFVHACTVLYLERGVLHGRRLVLLNCYIVMTTSSHASAPMPIKPTNQSINQPLHLSRPCKNLRTYLDRRRERRLGVLGRVLHVDGARVRRGHGRGGGGGGGGGSYSAVPGGGGREEEALRGLCPQEEEEEREEEGGEQGKEQAAVIAAAIAIAIATATRGPSWGSGGAAAAAAALLVLAAAPAAPPPAADGGCYPRGERVHLFVVCVVVKSIDRSIVSRVMGMTNDNSQQRSVGSRQPTDDRRRQDRYSALHMFISLAPDSGLALIS